MQYAGAVCNLTNRAERRLGRRSTYGQGAGGKGRQEESTLQTPDTLHGGWATFTLVTDQSRIPHGVISWNGRRSLARFMAKPWYVTQRCALTPMAATFLPPHPHSGQPWQLLTL